MQAKPVHKIILQSLTFGLLPGFLLFSIKSPTELITVSQCWPCLSTNALRVSGFDCFFLSDPFQSKYSGCIQLSELLHWTRSTTFVNHRAHMNDRPCRRHCTGQKSMGCPLLNDAGVVNIFNANLAL